MPTPQNGQTHSNNMLAKADKLFECVLPFYEVGNERVNREKLLLVCKESFYGVDS